MTTIGFIPARGGSRRIPRKNLRAVQGVPLIVGRVRALLAAGCERVIVSTDDAEIMGCAELAGAQVDARPPDLCGPDVTIDEVVWEWLARHPAAAHLGTRDVIAVAQPTSPLLGAETIRSAIERCRATGETIISVVAERHLLWSAAGRPLQRERRNSTTHGEPEIFRETGGIVAFAPSRWTSGWPPNPVTTMEVDDVEGIDIDSYEELTRARAGARPAHVQIRYIEGLAVGAGHRYRAEALAVELADRHEVELVQAQEAQLAPAVPDAVILDALDTEEEQISRLFDAGVRVVITMEDRGTGAKLATATINELYAEGGYCGPKWAVLRPEFQGHALRQRVPDKDGRFSAVVSFGGTDPADQTSAITRALCRVPALRSLRVIVPPARADFAMDVPELAPDTMVQLISRPLMAREFLQADVAVTSAGRTVHEAAACGCPVVAVPVNAREAEHAVCPGITYLSPNASPEHVAEVVAMALADPAGRLDSARRARAAVDGLGAQRIGWLLDGYLGGML